MRYWWPERRQVARGEQATEMTSHIGDERTVAVIESKGILPRILASPAVPFLRRSAQHAQCKRNATDVLGLSIVYSPTFVGVLAPGPRPIWLMEGVNDGEVCQEARHCMTKMNDDGVRGISDNVTERDEKYAKLKRCSKMHGSRIGAAVKRGCLSCSVANIRTTATRGFSVCAEAIPGMLVAMFFLRQQPSYFPKFPRIRFPYPKHL